MRDVGAVDLRAESTRRRFIAGGAGSSGGSGGGTSAQGGGDTDGTGTTTVAAEGRAAGVGEDMAATGLATNGELAISTEDDDDESLSPPYSELQPDDDEMTRSMRSAMGSCVCSPTVGESK